MKRIEMLFPRTDWRGASDEKLQSYLLKLLCACEYRKALNCGNSDWIDIAKSMIRNHRAIGGMTRQEIVNELASVALTYRQILWSFNITDIEKTFYKDWLVLKNSTMELFEDLARSSYSLSLDLFSDDEAL